MAARRNTKNIFDSSSSPSSFEVFGESRNHSPSTTSSPRRQPIAANPSPAAAEKSDFYPAGGAEMTNESGGFENVGEGTGSWSDGRRGGGGFPPPITTIGSGGKPRVYFESIRKDGRFVLREIRIPTQRLLQARREDGRLKMRVLRQRDDGEMKEGEEED